MIALLFALAAAAPAAQDELITVKAKAAGPALAVPAPAPSKPLVDEVLKTLALGRDAAAPPGEVFKVSPDASRLERPFPEPPFFALSPENIEALYDSWSFEIRTNGEIVWRTEGVGLVQERLDWEGGGPNGRLALVPGGTYFYRFTGRRGSRSFTIQSDPVRLRSFAHREYVGETRLEVDAAELFEEGRDAFKASGRPFLDAMAARLRTGELRPDGSFRLELYMKDARGELARSRARSVARFMTGALAVGPKAVKVDVLPAERGEALAAFVPPSKGPGLRIE